MLLFNVRVLSAVLILITGIEWYLLGLDFNESIDFKLSCVDFKEGKLGIVPKTEKLPKVKLFCYTLYFIYLLTRIAIFFYMVGLLGDCRTSNEKR